MGRAVALAGRADLGEGIAGPRDVVGQAGQRLLDVLGVVDVADAGADLAVQILRVEAGQAGIHRHRADRVLLALFDGDRDHPTVGVRTLDVAGVGVDDAEVGVALAEVVAPDEVEVVGDPVGIVDVGGLDERQEVHLGRGYQPLQRPLAHRVVADEADRDDAGLIALVDLVDHVDRAVGQVDGPVGDLGGPASGAAVDFLDPRQIGLDHRLVEGAPGLRLDLPLQGCLLDLLVALEHHAVDQIVLAHRHHGATAAGGDLDIREHAAGEQVAAGLLGRARCGAGDVGTDGVGIDAAVALNDDLLGLCDPGQRNARRGG